MSDTVETLRKAEVNKRQNLFPVEDPMLGKRWTKTENKQINKIVPASKRFMKTVKQGKEIRE